MKSSCSLICLFIFLLTPLLAQANESNFIDYHRITAKSGDGIIVVLKRFELYDHSENRAAFYELNNLKRNAQLLIGKEYILPIKKYKYNGQSIRSTIGKDDWDLAKKIAAYNRTLRDKKLKSTYYLDDRVLFTPIHLVADLIKENQPKKEVIAKSKSETKTTAKKTPTKTIATATPIPASDKSSKATKNEYHRVEAKRGDGVITIMKRYGLTGSTCNMDAFYKLNNLKANEGLLAGKTYYLPIQIFKYNRESIRSTIGKDDWDIARSIASYNRSLKANNLKPTYYMDDAILYVPLHFLDCPETATMPVAKKKVEKAKNYLTNNLYGPEHRKFEKVSDDLKGQAFYIIGGHGGPDPGAVYNYGEEMISEDEYAYDVCLRLARKLEANGAKVFMIIQDENDGIREDHMLPLDYDEVCIGGDKIPRKQGHRLRQRSKAVNRLYAKNKNKYKSHKVMSIHIDSQPRHKRQDIYFYYCPGSKEGRRQAEKIQDTFREKYELHRGPGKYDGTVTDRNLYVLRHTDPTAVFVELANIRNHIDQKRIMIPWQREVVASWLYEGWTK